MASAAGIEQSRAALNIAASGEQHKNILGEQPAPDATCADIGEGARGLHAGLGLRDGRGGNAVLEGDEGGQADLVEVQHGARPLRCLTVSRAALPYVRLGKAVRVDVVRAVKAVDELGNEAERRQRKIRRAAKRARRARRAAAEAAAVGQPGIGAEQGVKPEVGGQNADVGAGAGCREMAQKENGANDGGGQPGGIGGVLREGKLQEGAGEPAGRSPKRRKVVGEGLVPGGEEKLKLQTGAAGLGPLTGMGAGGPAAEEGLEASRQAASALAQGCGRADAHAGVPSAGEDHEQHAKAIRSDPAAGPGFQAQEPVQTTERNQGQHGARKRKGEKGVARERELKTMAGGDLRTRLEEEEKASASEERASRDVPPQKAAFHAALGRLGRGMPASQLEEGQEPPEEEATQELLERKAPGVGYSGFQPENLEANPDGGKKNAGCKKDAGGLAGFEPQRGPERNTLRKAVAEAAERRAVAAKPQPAPEPAANHGFGGLVLGPPGPDSLAGGGVGLAEQGLDDMSEDELPFGRLRNKYLRRGIEKRSLLDAFDLVGEVDQVVPETPSEVRLTVPSEAELPGGATGVGACASVQSKQCKKDRLFAEEGERAAWKEGEQLERAAGLELGLRRAPSGEGFGNKFGEEADVAALRRGSLPAPLNAQKARQKGNLGVFEESACEAAAGADRKKSGPGRTSAEDEFELSAQEWEALRGPSTTGRGLPIGRGSQSGLLPSKSRSSLEAGQQSLPLARRKVAHQDDGHGRTQQGPQPAEDVPSLGSRSESVGGKSAPPGAQAQLQSPPCKDEGAANAFRLEACPGSDDYYIWPRKRRAVCLEEDDCAPAKRAKGEGAEIPVAGLPLEKDAARPAGDVSKGKEEGWRGRGTECGTGPEKSGAAQGAEAEKSGAGGWPAETENGKQAVVDRALRKEKRKSTLGPGPEGSNVASVHGGGVPFGRGAVQGTSHSGLPLRDVGTDALGVNSHQAEEVLPPVAAKENDAETPEAAANETWVRYKAASKEQRAALRFDVLGLVTKIGGWAFYLLAGTVPKGEVDPRPIAHGTRRQLMDKRAALDFHAKPVRELPEIGTLTESRLRRKAWKASHAGGRYVVRRLVGKKLTESEQAALGSACTLLKQVEFGGGVAAGGAAPAGGCQRPIVKQGGEGREGGETQPDVGAQSGGLENRALCPPGQMEVFYEVPTEGRRPRRQRFLMGELAQAVAFATRVEKWLHDPRCSICQFDVEAVSELCQTEQCGHIFHRSCLLNWLTSSNSCPTCRARIPVFEGATIAHRNLKPTYDEDQEANEFADVMCEVCSLDETEDEAGNYILICDNCNKGYHLWCIGLAAVPEGDWYCPPCHAAFLAACARLDEPRLASQNPQRQTRRQRQSNRAAQDQLAAGRSSGNGSRSGNGLRPPVLAVSPESPIRDSGPPSPDLGDDGMTPPRRSPRLADRRFRGDSETGDADCASPRAGTGIRGGTGVRQGDEHEGGSGRNETDRGRVAGVGSTGRRDRSRAEAAGRRSASPVFASRFVPSSALSERSPAGAEGGLGADETSSEDRPIAHRAGMAGQARAAAEDGGGEIRSARTKENLGRKRKNCGESGPKACERCKRSKKGGSYCLRKGHGLPAGEPPASDPRTSSQGRWPRSPDRPQACQQCKRNKKGGTYCLSLGHPRPG